MGIVIYSEIVSLGYFAQQGQWIIAAMNTARSANPARILWIAVALALITASSDISCHKTDRA
jgi:hypothetical protein